MATHTKRQLHVMDIFGYQLYDGDDFTDATESSEATRDAMRPFLDFMHDNTASDRILSGKHFVVVY